jgi:hypothetical protein
VVVDSNPAAPPSATYRSTCSQPDIDYPIRGYGDALFNDVYETQRIDFGFLEAQYKTPSLSDPLADGLFQTVHRRAERLERSIRNTEKGRAQHEKDQIIRLLEGLQGHDWLRVMGVSGVTETKKKTFEPARNHFIKGCQGIIDKFRNWSLEERRRKAEKDKALADRIHDKDEDNSDEEEDADEDEGKSNAESKELSPQDDTSDASSPAKQLREEAMARSKLAKSSRKVAPARVAPPRPPQPPKEFRSFFNKKHERDGALNRHRRAGRKVLAWGHPIPDIPQTDYDLPEEYRDGELMKARARKKRREKRGHRT